MSPKPYYQDDAVTIYHGAAEAVLPHLGWFDLLLSDPPYPNGAGHFDAGIPAARAVIADPPADRVMVFWHQLEAPECSMRLVARHVWHRTNTNRPDNYEAIYEFADDEEKPSRVFPFAVIYPGLTGCVEASGHPTQKNLKLMQALALLRPCETVLDPFAGSGTTLEAVKRLGRKAVGVEINERYCEIAARRCAQEVLDLPEVA